MPEDDDSRAKLAAKRALEAMKDPVQPVGIAETPEARQRRFASRAPDGETPEQRSARYLEKARRAGMLEPTPTSPLNVRNDLTQARAGAQQKLADHPLVARAQAWLDSIHKGSPEEDDRIHRALNHTFSPLTITDRGLQTRGAAEANDEQDRQVAENQRAIEIAKQYAPRDGGEIDEPVVRQPIQMERTFSNDADKEAYLERIRQAQRAVK